MLVIPYSVNTGEYNMKEDEALLNNAISSHLESPILRLYGWAPACVSLGRNQDDKFLDKGFLNSKNIDVVRRLTGGRALLHDNEITYSIVCPVSYLKNGEHVVSSYMEISKFLTDRFQKAGICLTFGTEKPVKTGFDYCMLVSTGADLCYNGKKLIGSAQCRKNGYILQHGSILYDYDKNLLEEIFGEKVDSSEITTIKEINPALRKEDVINILSSEV
ncbi:MAG: lipoate--protein ligase family protein [Muribaculaceae bacterium]|nr:lipoate--protein ligase family protein [Muribaculaceae bacterium]